MGKKGWIIFVIVVVGLLATLVIVSRNANPPIDVSNINENTILSATEVSGNIADHVYGNKDAKVMLVEYGDLQCPACGAAHPNLKVIAEEYKDQIAFVFRNFPLSQIHPNAKAAAAVAEAAGLQGKYWEMNNYLYEHQSEWSSLSGGTEITNKFVSYAETLSLDIEQFKSDIASDAVKQKIAFDYALGNKLGVNSTPTLYLDGVQVDSDVVSDVQSESGDQLRTLINNSLTKANVALPSEQQ